MLASGRSAWLQLPPAAEHSLYVAATIGARSFSAGLTHDSAKSLRLRHRSPPSTLTGTCDGGVLSTRAVTGGELPRFPAASRACTTTCCVPSSAWRVLTVICPAPFGHGASLENAVSVAMKHARPSAPASPRLVIALASCTPTLSRASYRSGCSPPTHAPSASGVPELMAATGGCTSVILKSASSVLMKFLPLDKHTVRPWQMTRWTICVAPAGSNCASMTLFCLVEARRSSSGRLLCRQRPVRSSRGVLRSRSISLGLPFASTAYSSTPKRQSARPICPCQRNHVMTVPGGAVIVAIERASRFTTPRRCTFAVTSPCSPGSSGLQARLIRIPRVAKTSNAVDALFSLSDWHAATANSPPIVVAAHTSITVSAAHVALVIAASVLRIVFPL